MLPSMDEPVEAIREPVDILAQSIHLVGIDQELSSHKSLVERPDQCSTIKSKHSTFNEEFLEKYRDRELFHRRSKDNMYRKMCRKNQALETKCKEKDYKIETLEANLRCEKKENELLRRQIQELKVLSGM